MVLEEGAQGGYNFWNDIKLIHNALPEVDKDSISLRTEFLGAKLDAPIIISSMTGGYSGAKEINTNLAYAAQNLKIAFSIGSQRAALKEPELADSYKVVADFSPPLVFANIGAPQLLALSYEEVRGLMAMIKAQGLMIHLNFAQEVVQESGDTRGKGCLDAIRRMAQRFALLAKETGWGISREVAQRLKVAGVRGIDVGGAGGTNFIAVEYHRAKRAGDEAKARLARTFFEWGIPTPVSLVQARVGLPLIATGGIRTGLDAAKAIALGADIVGLAYPLLKPATTSGEAVVETLKSFIEELRTAMFLTGSENIGALKNKQTVITGLTKEWLDGLGETS